MGLKLLLCLLFLVGCENPFSVKQGDCVFFVDNDGYQFETVYKVEKIEKGLTVLKKPRMQNRVVFFHLDDGSKLIKTYCRKDNK